MKGGINVNLERVLINITFKEGKKNHNEVKRVTDYLFNHFGNTVKINNEQADTVVYKATLLRTFHDTEWHITKGSESLTNKVRSVESITMVQFFSETI